MANFQYRYEKSPLAQVICQLTFPTILRIDNEDPVNFQEKIRTKFPIYQLSTNFSQEINNELLLSKIVPPSILTSKSHSFTSESGESTVALNKQAISITTNAYTFWNEFLDELLSIQKVFEEEYKPSYYERVGLRYINIIDPFEIGLVNVSWRDLITPEFSGLFGLEDKDTDVIQFASNQELDLKNGTHLRISTAKVLNTSNGHIGFNIDIDSFSFLIRTTSKDVPSLLDLLHRQNKNMFRKSITAKMHDLLIPNQL